MTSLVTALAVMWGLCDCRAGDQSELIKIGLGSGFSSNIVAEPVQWMDAPRGVDADGFFKLVGGVPTGIKKFFGFRAAPPFVFALNRQGREIRLATIREDGKIDYKENIPKTFVDGDILFLLACEPGIDRAKELDRVRKRKK